MATRDYEGAGITVHWDSDRCIHSDRCVDGAPSVFDRSARPWVDVTGLAADDLARVIDTCPSGALTYTRTDGAGHGRRGWAIDEDPDAALAPDAPSTSEVSVTLRGTPSITPEQDGPLVVVGPLTLVEADGSIRTLVRATLCRCGQSSSKPFCDGTHERVGFRAAGVEHPYPAAAAATW